ncbi:MAG TPA: hypothetical protein VEX86_04980, partial [Longimicrobium sp.]|nr:hypothetical protein [Longimicrobium sp.]
RRCQGLRPVRRGESALVGHDRRRGEVAGRSDAEENREVVNVFPQVNVTPAGDFLVADGREAQIRV